MPTSSFFHNIVLDTPEKVERFLDALYDSMNDNPYVSNYSTPEPPLSESELKVLIEKAVANADRISASNTEINNK